MSQFNNTNSITSVNKRNFHIVVSQADDLDTSKAQQIWDCACDRLREGTNVEIVPRHDQFELNFWVYDDQHSKFDCISLPCKPRNIAEVSNLQRFLNIQNAKISYINSRIDRFREKSIVSIELNVDFHQFYGQLLELDNIQICLGEEIKKALMASSNASTNEELNDIMHDYLHYYIKGKPFFFFAMPNITNQLLRRREEKLAKKQMREEADSNKGNNANNGDDNYNYDIDDIDDNDSTDNVDAVEELAAFFYLFAGQNRLTISKDRDDRWILSKISQMPAKFCPPDLRLAEGEIQFDDMSRSSRQNTSLLRATLHRLGSQQRSYLHAWDRYGNEASKALLTRARDFGAISTDDLLFTPVPTVNSHTSKIEITLKNQQQIKRWEEMLAILTENDSVQIQEVVPPYLKAEYELSVDHLEDIWDDVKSHQRANRDSKFYLGSAKKRGMMIILSGKSDQLPALAESYRGMYLMLATHGDQIQFERQKKARKRVLECQSAMPFLGNILEEGLEALPIQGARHTISPAISAAVCEKLFSRNAPTSVQKAAVDIALNTPDIALIQGPPGTGKTTVITAIIERLNELKRKDRLKGDILVTGFQHEAVENITLRLSVNALPPHKFGGKQDDLEDRQKVLREQQETWVNNITGALRANTQGEASIPSLEKFETTKNAYIRRPDDTVALQVAEELLRFQDKYTRDCRRDLEALVTELRQANVVNQQTDYNSDLLKNILSWRTNLDGFLDDGPHNAKTLYEFLQKERLHVEPNIKKHLQDCAGKPPSFKPDTTFLKRCQKYRNQLLKTYAPKVIFDPPQHHTTLLNCMGKIEENIRQEYYTKHPKDAISFILNDFSDALEADSERAIRDLERYRFVFAATCQQADGKEIQAHKKADPNDWQGLPYDTVIIDEAARVNPNDILIPMVKAENRIILVGDHRQLPHIVDEELARRLETSDTVVGDGNKIDLSESIFSYLKGRLETLSRADGFPRVITLDEQYRTHPALGELVSKYFYKPYGEEYGSPLPSDLFAHRLPRTNGKPMVWVNIPYSQRSKEMQDSVGKSRYRVAEAEAIAERLVEWMQSPKGEDLSFGIISFYKKQIECIYEALAARDIVQKEEGRYIIKEQFRLKKDGSERLRIGTVDAFQGMEFDVVLLSMVRSSPPQNTQLTTPKEVAQCAQRRFGHLLSPNRLCVSLSRQKRLLAVFGDADMLDAKHPEVAYSPDGRVFPLHALQEFYKLCKTGQSGVVL